MNLNDAADSTEFTAEEAEKADNFKKAGNELFKGKYDFC